MITHSLAYPLRCLYTGAWSGICLREALVLFQDRPRRRVAPLARQIDDNPHGYHLFVAQDNQEHSLGAALTLRTEAPCSSGCLCTVYSRTVL